MSSRSAERHYSDKNEQSQEDREKRDQEDRDFFAELTEEKIDELERTAHARSLEPFSQDEIARMMAALDDLDPPDDDGAPDPAPQEAAWLAEFKALARKHRPFSTVQVVEIVRVLFRANDPSAEAGR
jgi:hypothetical protein